MAISYLGKNLEDDSGLIWDIYIRSNLDYPTKRRTGNRSKRSNKVHITRRVTYPTKQSNFRNGIRIKATNKSRRTGEE